jgi:predicted Zn-dependent protease
VNAADRQLETRGLVANDAALEQHLAALAAPLLPATPLENVTWRFHVLRDPMVNAFALPNGSIYVNSGLLSRAENDDQLAGVLAHEIVHVTDRHSYLTYRSLRRKSVLLNISSAAMAFLPGGRWGMALYAMTTASQFAVIASVYGYSRELEASADEQGLQRMRASRHDPAQMIRMFALLDQRLEPEPVPLFWRSHPKIQKRIAALRQSLGTTADVPATPQPGYLDRIRPVLLQDIRLDLDSRAFRTAVASSQRMVNASPRDAEARYWLAESYRQLGPREPALSTEEKTDNGQRKAYRAMLRMTEQEENEKLSKTPRGRTALAANQARAESLFKQASDFPASFLGLGLLYEQQAKPDAALFSYRTYLARSPEAPDRERVERRINALTQTGGPQ